ncbi:DUF5979 domain-containing protein [Corynebacterium durum]|uniref:DUF5979 domain-containing protein n=1 Tax=Corynebacterium durum TaxID=61592 RepID=UPI0026DC15DE|nr:DUF5979 domain-containing protein [Corynebacterium durum]MDO4652527.1 DUF5979 domain-containing protein [Corynebacterium durum]
MIKPMTRQVGAVIAAILTIVSLLGASLVNPSVAHAVQTPGYTVSNILVNNKALAAGQNVRNQLTPMTFDWSGEALNRTPKEGEGFEVAFPPQLQIAGSSLGKLDLIFEGKKIGDCNLSNGATSLISCVFDSGVNDITSKEVKGSGELKVIASTARREAYTADTIDFQVNGTPVAAGIPGGIAKAADARYQPSKLSKYSTPIGERNKAVPWSIAFNPSLLAATVPSLGTPGNGNLTYRFIDTMGEGYDYETLLQGNPWTLQMVNSQDNPAMPAKRLADTNGTSDPDYPGFSITVTGSGRNREVTVTGPFQPDTNYRLSVPGKLPGTAIPGIAYTNDVRLDGTNETASGTISYIKTAKVTLAMRDGYGAVSIVKRVLGPAAASVPTTTKYPVTINFTLPNGKTVADFPEWTDKPAGLNPSDTSGSVTFSEVVAGSFTNVPNTFPAGTTMTFEETPPAVPNIQWNTAKTTFEPKTLTVQEKQQSELSVSNVAQYADGTFQVKKTIADPKPANAPQSVKLYYQCNADSVDGAVKANTDTELTVNTDGTLVDGAVFHAGTECKVTREADADIADYGIAATGLNTAVTIAEGKAASNIAAVTNTYTKQAGTFQVKKVVADPKPADAPASVKLFYQCNADSVDGAIKANTDTELSVNTDGTLVDGAAFPRGTECKVTREADESVAGYGVASTGLNATVTLAEGKVADNIATVTNTYTRKTGTFQAKKVVADPKPANAPQSVKLFYQCNADSVDGAIKANTDTELTANTDGAPVDGASFPVGTECKVTREADEAVVDHTVKTAGLNTAVTLKEGKVAENIATVTNTYAQKVGTFQMKKLINAPADDAAFVAPKTVKFTYTCDADSVDKTVKAGVATEVSVPVGDTPVDGSEFPVGTKCTVAQESEHAVAGYNSVPAGLAQPVTIAEGKVANNIATVTNTYTKQVGSFSVTKVVNADSTIIDLNPDHEYSFNYVCTKDGAEVAKGELKVNGDNTVKSPDIPVGASCTVTEDEASARGAVDNAVLDMKVSGPAMITENTTTPVTVTNKYTRATSSFTVKKKVEGLPAPGAKEFSFLYKCVYGEDVKAGEIKVKGNGETTVKDVPAGSECTVTENVDAAKQDGYTLVIDNAEQKFDQGTQPTTVLFTNVYTKDTGSLSVTKSLKDPDGVAAGKKFNFAYACEHKDPAQRKEGTFQLGAGESTTIDDIAAASTCTITEKDADVKGADLATSGLDSVVIVKGKTHDVIATNDYSAWRGSVELSKALAGSGKDLAAVKDKKFNVSYVCTLGTDKKEVKKGTVEVIAGTPATIDDVRYGATCEIAEDTANAEVPGAMFDKNSSVTSATATISSKDTAATANLVNVYNVKGKVTLTKAVEGLTAGVDGNKSRDYEVEASWKDPQSGDTKTETYKVADGKFAELPELPAHTVITLKEKKPENTAITSWSTPGYTGDPAAAVKDNRDGTATVTIPADGSAVAVTLTNTANVPWWWIFVPLIPAAIIPNLPTTAPDSSGSGSTAPGHTAPAAGPRQNDPAPTQPTKATDGTPVKGTPKGHQGQPGQAGATPKDDAQKSSPARAVQKVLANTGASVIGIIVIAVLLLIAGLVLALRGRRSQ